MKNYFTKIIFAALLVTSCQPALNAFSWSTSWNNFRTSVAQTWNTNPWGTAAVAAVGCVCASAAWMGLQKLWKSRRIKIDVKTELILPAPCSQAALDHAAQQGRKTDNFYKMRMVRPEFCDVSHHGQAPKNNQVHQKAQLEHAIAQREFEERKQFEKLAEDFQQAALEESERPWPHDTTQLEDMYLTARIEFASLNTIDIEERNALSASMNNAIRQAKNPLRSKPYAKRAA